MVLARLPVLLVAPALALLAPSMAAAQTPPNGIYMLDRTASAVGFTISGSMIIKVKRDGRFQEFTGRLAYNPAHPAETQLDLTVYTASVDTHDSEQDHLLKSSDFFDVEHFPTMRFVSTVVAANTDGTFSVTGDMTIRGITKQLTIPVKLRRSSRDLGQHSPIFESTFQIDRTEFGLNGLPKWNGLKVSISKNIEVRIAMATTTNGPGLER
jgi:polyisoprenoid-binding protein YceI